MICTKCEKRLKILRTINAGPAGRTQDAVCSSCGGKYTVVSVVLEAKGYGEGSRGRAKEILRRGVKFTWSDDGKKIFVTPSSTSPTDK